MHVALFSWETLHSIAVGGVAAHVSGLAAALHGRGHQVHIFTRPGPEQSNYECIGGVHYHRCPFELPSDLVDNVAWLRNQTDLPICIGFGISRPEHARLLAPVADGLIVGSAIVRRIAQVAEKSPEEVLRKVGEMTAEMVAAMNE